MVKTDGNAVIQDQSKNAQGGRIQANRVPKETERGRGVCIATINIRLGQAWGLKTALRTLRQGSSGVGVLKETKLTGGIHTRRNSGYKVWEMEAESKHPGGKYPLPEGRRIYGGLRECGALSQM